MVWWRLCKPPNLGIRIPDIEDPHSTASDPDVQVPRILTADIS